MQVKKLDPIILKAVNSCLLLVISITLIAIYLKLPNTYNHEEFKEYRQEMRFDRDKKGIEMLPIMILESETGLDVSGSVEIDNTVEVEVIDGQIDCY